MIERFNRTIRDKITKYWILNHTKEFITELPNLVNSYNKQIHSTIKMTPAEAKKKGFVDTER